MSGHSVETASGKVQTEARAGRVFHNVHDDEFGETYAYLSPDQARRVADLLNTAAEAAERQAAEPLTGNCTSCMAPHSKRYPCIWGV